MATDLFLELLRGAPRVRRRASPLAGDLRIAWGVAIVLLVVASSRGNRCSFQKLHFLAHAVRTPEARQHALSLLSISSNNLLPMFRVEPWINRAVNFASALGMVSIDGGKSLRLLDGGEGAVSRLSASENILADERAFLRAVRPYATEKNIEEAMRPRNLL